VIVSRLSMTHTGAAGRRHFAALALLAALALAAMHALPAVAQQFPTKVMRFVVPYPAGGPLDQVARALAEKLRDTLGQPMIVENRPGAGGNIGADLVAKAPPDGHTIVMGAVATHAINPYLYSKMPYDANRDFVAVTRIAVVPNVLVMNPEAAHRMAIASVRDLIAYAKRNPGKLNYASGGNGSAGHLAGELFKSQAGISMVHIPYAGAAAALIGLAGGQTDLMFDNLASAAPQIRAGKLVAFAVTTPGRSSFFPELPTVAESGLPGFDIDTWFGVFAPAGTPGPIVEKLYREFSAALATPDLKERLGRMGAEPAPLAPAEFAAFVRREQTKYQRIVEASGAHID
jgi:tripartite-type tricarboxylate transporter receptor subunit TctC